MILEELEYKNRIYEMHFNLMILIIFNDFNDIILKYWSNRWLLFTYNIVLNIIIKLSS